jgi:hypothetical protein
LIKRSVSVLFHVAQVFEKTEKKREKKREKNVKKSVKKTKEKFTFFTIIAFPPLFDSSDTMVSYQIYPETSAIELY